MLNLRDALIDDDPARLSPRELTSNLYRLLVGRPTSVQIARAKREAKREAVRLRTEARARKKAERAARKEERHNALRLRHREREQQARESKRAEKQARRTGGSAKGAASLPLITEKPYTIDNIELTNRCPMRCVMCPRTKHMTRSQGHMDFEVFEKIIGEYLEINPTGARQDGIYLHHFGESIVHPEFDRFITYANERQVATRISINPLMLKERNTDKLLAANPTEIMISLDGHDDESFYRIRGVKNAYTLSVNRLLDFLKKRIAIGNRSKVELSMINFSENSESIAEMRTYWESVEGIDEFVLKNFTTWDGSAADINEFSTFTIDNAERRKKHERPGCNLPWRKMTVTWDGDVVPCCYDYNKKFILGNVREQSLAEIWNGPRMQALREEFNSNHVTNPLCVNCPALYSD